MYVKEKYPMNLSSNEQYKKEKTTIIPMRVFHSTDADIIEHLSLQKNRTGYIKALIRKDIEEGMTRDEVQQPYEKPLY